MAQHPVACKKAVVRPCVAEGVCRKPKFPLRLQGGPTVGGKQEMRALLEGHY